MTRKDRLYAMRMVELVEVAEAEGIKIDRKGSKAKAVEKILAAEAAREEVVAEEREALVESFQTEEPEDVSRETIEADEVAEDPKKRERKNSRKSFEELVAVVPVLKSGLQFIRMKNNSVSVKSGKARLFRLDYISDGYQLTADRKASVQLLGSNKVQHLTADRATEMMDTVITALA